MSKTVSEAVQDVMHHCASLRYPSEAIRKELTELVETQACIEKKRVDKLKVAAEQWESVASDLDQLADHEDGMGQPYGSTETKRNNAKLYRKTAKVIRLEADTGKPHCMDCLGDHSTSDHHKQLDKASSVS